MIDEHLDHAAATRALQLFSLFHDALTAQDTPTPLSRDALWATAAMLTQAAMSANFEIAEETSGEIGTRDAFVADLIDVYEKHGFALDHELGVDGTIIASLTPTHVEAVRNAEKED